MPENPYQPPQPEREDPSAIARPWWPSAREVFMMVVPAPIGTGIFLALCALVIKLLHRAGV